MKYKDLVNKVLELKNKVLELEKIIKEKELKPTGEREKITLQEFFKSKEELAIHCDTLKKAKVLLNAFDSYGKKWANNKKYTEENHYDYEDKTCYGNDGYFADVDYYNNEVDYYNNENVKTYKFEDVILPEKPKWTFTEDEKVILRNIEERFKWIARDEYNTRLYCFTDKPYKKKDFWFSGTEFEEAYLFSHLFQTIKWEDSEPCEFRKYI